MLHRKLGGLRNHLGPSIGTFMNMLCGLLFPCLLLAFPPVQIDLPPTAGANIQRTMQKLARSTAERPEHVRILFYGQSITEQTWSKEVGEYLKKTYPTVKFDIQNKAIGGFSSQRLVKTAESDLYPVNADLVIFHVYGSHTDYELIMKRLRERTTSEIIMQTDHLNADDKIDEETQKVTMKQWQPWMNYGFLPGVAAKYKTELVDQRNIWKSYLKANKLEPKALLRDNVHLNDHGNFIMAEIVKPYLRVLKDINPESANWVQTVDLAGKPEASFNRIEFHLKSPLTPAEIDTLHIDGRPITSYTELIHRTRTTVYSNTIWPVVLQTGIAPGKTPLLEEWKLKITEISADGKSCKFSCTGSKTGADGTGDSTKAFTSTSGRVVIAPTDWDLSYGLDFTKQKLYAGFEIQWKELPNLVKDKETITLFGLEKKKHTIEVPDGLKSKIQSVTVHLPPG
jgi:hypothetical protein